MRVYWLALGLILVPGMARAQSVNAPFPPAINVITTSTVTTSTTTLVVTGIANETTYLWFLGMQAQGTNSAATYQMITGTGATCGGSTDSNQPTLTTSATVGQMLSMWSAASAVQAAGPGTAAVPKIIQSGATPVNVCVVSAGTTKSAAFVALYAIAP